MSLKILQSFMYRLVEKHTIFVILDDLLLEYIHRK